MKGCPLSTQTATKSVVQGDYPAEVDARADCLQKCEMYSACSFTYSNMSPHPILDMKQKPYDKQTDSLSNSDDEK